MSRGLRVRCSVNPGCFAGTARLIRRFSVTYDREVQYWTLAAEPQTRIPIGSLFRRAGRSLSEEEIDDELVRPSRRPAVEAAQAGGVMPFP